MNYKSRLYHWLPLLLLLLSTKWIPAANGQIPLPATSPVYQPPDQVKRFGAIEATIVNFQSKQLFYVVSPTVADRQNPGEFPWQWPFVKEKEPETDSLLQSIQNRLITLHPLRDGYVDHSRA